MAWAVLVGGGALAAASAPLAAQDDVELLGRIHGTTPPPAYYEVKARDPGAFRFSRAWMARNPSLERMAPRVPGGPPRFRFRGDGPGGAGEPDGAGAGSGAGTAGGQGTAQVRAAGEVFRSTGAPGVVGTFHVPLILGEFAEGPSAEYTPSEIQAHFFDGPNGHYATIEEYYGEISGGLVDFQGETLPWVRTGLTQEEVVGSTQGLGGDSQVGLFILDILSELDDGSVDWGRYDNDGDDGVPNSGDDDGFVDILAVMHPTWGGECRSTGSDSRIWSHKWYLGGPGGSGAIGEHYVTTTPSANGGFIRVNDYAIQPVETCGGGEINEIGVLAHELGHGFGLPDLYAVGGDHQGIGEWGLMGSGSWGCQGDRAERPCHMSAWSKAVLGWVDVVPLVPGEDHGVVSFPPVAADRAVYRVDAGDGSGEYFLLENRQPLGFDTDLHAPGLLVWHVDPARVEARWPANQVNSDPSHMGVWLRQADGRDDLATPGGGRGDGGDPFPGSTGNRAFHAGSNPASWTHGGASAGLTLLDVETVASDVRARVLTRYQGVTVAVEGAGGEGGLLVDGAEVPATGHTFLSAPFEEHRIAAQGGTSAGEGVRYGFLEWKDDPMEGRERTWVTGLEDTSLVATFGGAETRLRVDVSGGAFGAEPGVVSVSPSVEPEADGRWFPQGTHVGLEAVPNTGFGFAEWTGAAAGQGNPAVVDMSEPADVGLAFELTYAVADDLPALLVAARDQTVVLVAENGTAPVTWFLDDGTPPQGMSFLPMGRIAGVPLEDGSFAVQVRARDARGLEASGVVSLEVAPPPVALTDLTGPFLQRSYDLTEAEAAYLDFSGNANGAYDLGDFRSFFLTHVEGAATASPAVALEGAVERRSVGTGSRAAGPDTLRVRVVRFPEGGAP